MNINRIIRKFNMENNEMIPIEFCADFSIAKTYVYKGKNKKKDDSEEENGLWIVEGYASTSDLDSQNSIITEKAIEEGAESLKKYTTLLYNHDMDRPIGKILLAEARIGGKLFVKCSISKSEEDIWEKIQDGTLSKFSIMGEILDADEEDIDGKTLLVIKSMRLFEASLVSVPANPEAKTLNWYIEKALQEKFSNSLYKKHDEEYTNDKKKKKNIKKQEDDSENEQEEDVGPEVEAEVLIDALDEAMKIMDTIISGLVGDYRNQAIGIVQWMQAIKEIYAPENQNTSSSTAKNMEDLTVSKKDFSLKDKDYVDVLDNVEQGFSDENPVDLEKSLSETNLTVKGDIVEKIEKTVIENSEIKEKEVIEESGEDTNLVKSMVGVVSELKDLAKSVVDSLNESRSNIDEISKVKKEMEISLNEVKELLKTIPIRKTNLPTVDETARVEEKALDNLRKKVKNFDSLPPQEQLRHYLKQNKVD